MNADLSLHEYRINKKLMGCDFELIVVDDDENKARTSLQKGVEEIQRIEELLSEFKPSSQTSLINQHAAEHEVTVDEEGDVLTARALQGHPLLKSAAERAALGWRFTPTRLLGEPVRVVGTITFNFHL